MKLKIIMTLITVALVILVVVISHLDANNETFDLGTIQFEEGIVNIYYFWGEGCPRCAEQDIFFERIKEEIGDYFNLHRFEVWYNENNVEVMTKVADIMNERVTGVPFTIIGEQTFTGFASWMEEDIIYAIKEQSTNNFDVMQISIEN